MLRIVTVERPWDARGTYDVIAGDYAEANAGAPSGYVARARALLLASLWPGARLADLGCGTGRDLGFFAEHGLHAVGVDLSLGMLRRREGARGVGVQGDLTALPFGREVFDAGWAALSLVHLPVAEQERALSEVARVLSPRAPFTLLTVAGAVSYAETVVYRPDAWRMYYPLTSHALEGVARRTGFEVLDLEEPPVERGRRPLLCARLRKRG